MNARTGGDHLRHRYYSRKDAGPEARAMCSCFVAPLVRESRLVDALRGCDVLGGYHVRPQLLSNVFVDDIATDMH